MQDVQLNRAINGLVKQLKRRLDALAQSRDTMGCWPQRSVPNSKTTDSTWPSTFVRAGSAAACRWLRSAQLERRIAFSPSVPDVWFEAPVGEGLQACANRVYERYFRQCEREEGNVAELLSSIALKGHAWVTTVELNVKTTAFKAQKT